jgi:hypothetical protein
MALIEAWKSSSFIVRFYQSPSGDTTSWHGQLEHVQTGEKSPFHGLQELAELMRLLSARTDLPKLSHLKEIFHEHEGE